MIPILQFVLMCKENGVLWVLQNDYEEGEILLQLLMHRLVTQWEETKGAMKMCL
jgi:hypothetical protein